MQFSDKLCLPSFIVDEARPAPLSLNKFFAKKKVANSLHNFMKQRYLCLKKSICEEPRTSGSLIRWTRREVKPCQLSLSPPWCIFSERKSFLSLHCFIPKYSQSSLVLRDPDHTPVVVSSEVVGRVLRNRTSRVTKSLHLQRNYLCQGIEYWTLEHNSSRY